MKTLSMYAWGKVHPMTFELDHYADNGNLYVGLLTNADGCPEPWQNLTVNLCVPCKENCGFIDVNNNGHEIIDWLTENGLGDITGREKVSGFCVYPEFAFNMEKLMEYVTEQQKWKCFMTEYQQQALDFLKACDATMEITLIGAETNRDWGDNFKRNKYNVTLKTPKGSMNFDFWDSANNTEIYHMTLEEYFRKKYRRHSRDSTPYEKSKANKELQVLKTTAVPTEYCILACLQKWEVGTMNDFFHEFGYEIHNADDMFSFLNTYNAVVKEYHDLCRIFTPEQMKKLREIQ